MLDEVKKKNPGAEIERVISAMFCKVTSINARTLRPIHEATGGRDGFVCVQTNPKNINDSEKMIQEVMYWQDAYREELGVDDVNIVYKLPAAKAAVRTAEDLVARGVRICMTLNFSVSQHEIFADIIQKGRKNGFVVLMAGFLDDNVAKELEKLGVDNPKQYAKWAGVAVMRKSYANLNARRIDKASIMAAAIRGPYTIECCLTDKKEAPVYFTTMPAKIEEFDAARPELKSHMNEAIPADVMAILEKSAIFNQAYNRDRLDMENVSDFVPLRAVLKVFTDAYVEIGKSLS
ncbi:MAG: transaldolase family protein [Planctomycetota bacterium]|jgi:transaldolase|nr:transaldolase family protein [Planctomycetota bacterium]